MSIWFAHVRSNGRGVVLVLAGGLLAGLLMFGVGRVVSVVAAASTKWTSCPGVSFYPLFSDGYDGSSLYGTNATHGRFGHGVLVCPLQLPPGATIKAVEFHLYDGYPGHDIGPCNLSRVRLDPPTGSIQSMAGPISTSGTPGFTTRADTSIKDAKVSNHYYAYYASCTLSYMSSDLGIIGVSVQYVP